MKNEPRPHEFLSEYLDWFEKDGLTIYYEELIKFKEHEIREIKKIIENLK